MQGACQWSRSGKLQIKTCHFCSACCPPLIVIKITSLPEASVGELGARPPVLSSWAFPIGQLSPFSVGLTWQHLLIHSFSKYLWRDKDVSGRVPEPGDRATTKTQFNMSGDSDNEVL